MNLTAEQAGSIRDYRFTERLECENEGNRRLIEAGLKARTPKRSSKKMKGLLITPEQCRGARGMLGLSQSGLADIAGVSRPAIAAFECGRRNLHVRSREQITAALEVCGIEFLSDNGVRLKGSKAERLRKP